MTTVMGFHYTLKDNEGTTIDSSAGKEPLWVMVGRGHIVEGLDSRLPDMNIGDTETIIVPAEQGYGLADPDLRLKVARHQFPPDFNLKPGDQFQTSPEAGAPVYTIMKIEGDDIYIDGNHALAGVELHFDIEIIGKRDATEEELTHGHAHGPTGCGHSH